MIPKRGLWFSRGWKSSFCGPFQHSLLITEINMRMFTNLLVLNLYLNRIENLHCCLKWICYTNMMPKLFMAISYKHKVF